jgi:hypothetical protein
MHRTTEAQDDRDDFSDDQGVDAIGELSIPGQVGGSCRDQTELQTPGDQAEPAGAELSDPHEATSPSHSYLVTVTSQLVSQDQPTSLMQWLRSPLKRGPYLRPFLAWFRETPSPGRYLRSGLIFIASLIGSLVSCVSFFFVLVLALNLLQARTAPGAAQAALFLTLIVFIVSYFAIRYYLDTWFVPIPIRNLPLDQRLKKLAEILTESSQAATAIEAELQLQLRIVEQMARRESRDEEVKKLTEKQVHAVQDLLGDTMGKRERGAFILNTVVSFIIGVLTTITTEIALRWMGILGR